MFSVSSETAVTCTMKPDTFVAIPLSWDGERKISLPFQQITAISREPEKDDQDIQSTADANSRRLALPHQFAERLIDIAEAVLDKGERVNCHVFGRHIAGLSPSTREPVVSTEGLPIARNLALGAIGVIGLSGEGRHKHYCSVPHTMIGLGEDTGESIQVMSINSELGIARNDDVLAFYEALFPDNDVDIYLAQESQFV